VRVTARATQYIQGVETCSREDAFARDLQRRKDARGYDCVRIIIIIIITTIRGRSPFVLNLQWSRFSTPPTCTPTALVSFSVPSDHNPKIFNCI
jgi:hypothetical protein